MLEVKICVPLHDHDKTNCLVRWKDETDTHMVGPTTNFLAKCYNEASVANCTGLAGKKNQTNPFQFYFFSEIWNFNVGGPVNQLIKNPTLHKNLYLPS
jgi:hypothetical protein